MVKIIKEVMQSVFEAMNKKYDSELAPVPGSFEYIATERMIGMLVWILNIPAEMVSNECLATNAHRAYASVVEKHHDLISSERKISSRVFANTPYQELPPEEREKYMFFTNIVRTLVEEYTRNNKNFLEKCSCGRLTAAFEGKCVSCYMAAKSTQ